MKSLLLAIVCLLSLSVMGQSDTVRAELPYQGGYIETITNRTNTYFERVSTKVDSLGEVVTTFGQLTFRREKFVYSVNWRDDKRMTTKEILPSIQAAEFMFSLLTEESY